MSNSRRINAAVKTLTDAGPLSVYIDSDAYTAKEKGELLSLISELYHIATGDRLVIDSQGLAEPNDLP